MSSRIHHHNANTISHLSQETPLPFKKYTKKRSWVWDWFEQDPDNKYRAVCLYCHQEIFRLDGDRGSPKKLITHVNSKHGINKENYGDEKNLRLRMEKLKNYIDHLGPLVTNRDDAISIGIMNSGVQRSPSMIPPFMEPTIHKSIMQTIPSPGPEIKPLPINDPAVTYIESLPKAPAIADPVSQPMNPSGDNYKYKSVDISLIDPSLSSHKPVLTERQEEIDRYNDLVFSHNKQVEEYNKTVIIRGNGGNLSLQKPMTPVIDSFADIENDSTTNDAQKALQKFLAENSTSFNTISFIDSPSFKNLVNILKKNPDQPI